MNDPDVQTRVFLLSLRVTTTWWDVGEDNRAIAHFTSQND